MKSKNCFLSAASLGVVAGAVRVLQYIWAIDSRGFYYHNEWADFLSGLLVGLLAVGALFSLFSGIRQKKEQVNLSYHFCQSAPTRILFFLLAAVSLGDALYRFLSVGFSPMILLCIFGSFTWALFGITKQILPFMNILPLLHLGGLIVDYFRQTYKYIQVSEYALSLLGLCAMTYFALLLLKALSGADCSRRRLVTGCCLLLTLGAASFIAPLTAGFSVSDLLFAVHGFTYCLLATLTLIWLPEKAVTQPPVSSSPDLQEMNTYISEIPEVQEDEL